MRYSPLILLALALAAPPVQAQDAKIDAEIAALTWALRFTVIE